MYNSIFLTKRITFFLAIFCLVIACKSNKEDVKPQLTTDATVAIQWMDTFLTVETYAAGYRPPVAARAVAYINLAAYETIVPSSATYQSVAPKFSGLTIPAIEKNKTYNYEVAVNEAYYYMMKNFFPQITDTYKALIETQYTTLNVSNISAEELERSKQFGQAVAVAVYTYSKADIAGDAAYLKNQPADYIAPNGIGNWQPTYPDYGTALLPYWGKVRTFAISEADKVAQAPIAYSTRSTSAFFAQGLEVYSTTAPLSNEQRWIAEFWSDDIYKLTFEPAGRWIAITQQVIRKEKPALDKVIYTYTKLGIGLSDVGVACWNSKYIYNVLRPIDYIRIAIEPSWKSKLNNPLTSIQGLTPPFPSYPSGHSSFGAVAAEVLTDVYGDNYAMTDNCHLGRTEFYGNPRSFTSFYAMSKENAYSRIPLGVHYRMDCDEGLRMGYAVGKKVNQLAWKK